MELSIKPARSFRRFRNTIRFHFPFLWFLINFIIGLAKISAPFLLIALFWQYGAQLSSLPSKLFDSSSQNVTANQFTTETEIVAVAKGEPAPGHPSIQNETAKQKGSSTTTSNASNASNAKSGDQTRSESESTSRIVNQQWVFDQRSEEFTVQFGTSPNSELLLEFVPAISSGSPISIYPFKKTPSGRLVFGIATGLYSTLEEAAAAIEAMPPAAQEFGPWIRPIGELQTDIRNTVNVPG